MHLHTHTHTHTHTQVVAPALLRCDLRFLVEEGESGGLLTLGSQFACFTGTKVQILTQKGWL